MLAQLLQFLFSGITVGATYALAALGFTLIYNASNVINFAQGEFIMLGGMLAVLGATLLPQSLWVLGVTALVVAALWGFFNHTLLGKAMLATSFNSLAAQLVGVHTGRVLFLSFAMSGALGALGGVLVTPITLTSYDVGIMLGLKGFVAAVVGGLLVGVLEALGAGYVSSAYKDAIPFALILLMLFFMSQGLLGARNTERV